MSGYLGYDPDLLAVLASQLRDAEADLSTIRSSDVEAAGALREVGAVSSRLRERWIPLVRNLVSCSVMTDYRPATIPDDAVASNQLAIVARRNHWRVSTDPVTMPDRPVTVEEAFNLSHWLNDHVDDVYAADELAFLRSRLASMLDRPIAAAKFLAGVEDATLARLVDTLSGRHADLTLWRASGLDASQQSSVDSIEGIVHDLGTLLARRPADSPATSAADLVAGMQPYGAALLVQHLQLDASELGRVAVEIIGREQADPIHRWYTNGVRAADILMTTIIATPDGPSRFLVASAATPHHVLTAADPELTNRILLAGTTPDVLSPSERAAVIGPLMEAVIWDVEDIFESYVHVNPDIAAVSGAVLAPYMIEYFVDIDNPLQVPHDLKARTWTYLSSEADALRAVSDQRNGLTSGLASRLGTDYVDDANALTELATLVQLLDGLTAAGAIAEAEAAQARWDLIWNALRLASNVVPGGPPVKPVVKSVVGTARFAATKLGWGPDDIAMIRPEMMERADSSSTVLASIAIGATFDSFVTQGTIPAGTTRPPVPTDTDGPNVGLRYLDDLQDWIGAADLEPATGAWLLLVSTTILAPQQATGATIAQFDEDDD